MYLFEVFFDLFIVEFVLFYVVVNFFFYFWCYIVWIEIGWWFMLWFLRLLFWLWFSSSFVLSCRCDGVFVFGEYCDFGFIV